MTFITVFLQMASLLVLIGAGWLGARAGMYDEHTNSQMSRLIVNIFNPMLVVSGAISAVGKISPAVMGQVFLIAIAMFAIFIIIGMALSPLFDRDAMQRKIFQLMFVFSNLGFIGIPVVTNVLGAEYVVYVTEFIMAYNLVFYTYGVSLVEGKFSAASLRAMINPGNVLTVFALCMVLFHIQLPAFLSTAVVYLGNVTSPMALFAVGFALANTDLKALLGDKRLYVFTAVKLLVIPAVLLAGLKLLPVSQELVKVCLIMFAMPVGNMPLMIGTQKGIDVRTCSGAILMTTVLCVVTIPLLMMLI